MGIVSSIAIAAATGLAAGFGTTMGRNAANKVTGGKQDQPEISPFVGHSSVPEGNVIVEILGNSVSDQVANADSVTDLGVHSGELKELFSIPQRCLEFKLQTDDATEKIIASFPVTPGLCMAGNVLPVTDVLVPTNLAYYGKLFNKWRGGLNYEFEVVASPFNNTTFYFAYAPGAKATVPPTYGQAKTLHSASLTIGGEVNTTRLTVEYNHTADYLYSTTHASDPEKLQWLTEDPTEDAALGWIYVYCQNPLITTAMAPTSVYINVYITACDDFRFVIPSCDRQIATPENKWGYEYWSAVGVWSTYYYLQPAALTFDDRPPAVADNYLEVYSECQGDTKPLPDANRVDGHSEETEVLVSHVDVKDTSRKENLPRRTIDTKSIFEDEYLVGNFTFNTGQSKGSILFDMALPEEFFKLDLAPTGIFEFHEFFRTGWQVTLSMNNISPQVGSLVLFYDYRAIPANVLNYNSTVFNLPSGKLQLGQQTSVSIDVPYAELTRTRRTSWDKKWGYLRVMVWNALLVGAGTATACTASVKIRMINTDATIRRIKTVNPSYDGGDLTLEQMALVVKRYKALSEMQGESATTMEPTPDPEQVQVDILDSDKAIPRSYINDTKNNIYNLLKIPRVLTYVNGWTEINGDWVSCYALPYPLGSMMGNVIQGTFYAYTGSVKYHISCGTGARLGTAFTLVWRDIAEKGRGNDKVTRKILTDTSTAGSDLSTFMNCNRVEWSAITQPEITIVRKYLETTPLFPSHSDDVSIQRNHTRSRAYLLVRHATLSGASRDKRYGTESLTVSMTVGEDFQFVGLLPMPQITFPNPNPVRVVHSELQGDTSDSESDEDSGYCHDHSPFMRSAREREDAIIHGLQRNTDSIDKFIRMHMDALDRIRRLEEVVQGMRDRSHPSLQRKPLQCNSEPQGDFGDLHYCDSYCINGCAAQGTAIKKKRKTFPTLSCYSELQGDAEQTPPPRSNPDYDPLINGPETPSHGPHIDSEEEEEDGDDADEPPEPEKSLLTAIWEAIVERMSKLATVILGFGGHVCDFFGSLEQRITDIVMNMILQRKFGLDAAKLSQYKETALNAVKFAKSMFVMVYTLRKVYLLTTCTHYHFTDLAMDGILLLTSGWGKDFQGFVEQVIAMCRTELQSSEDSFTTYIPNIIAAAGTLFMGSIGVSFFGMDGLFKGAVMRATANCVVRDAYTIITAGIRAVLDFFIDTPEKVQAREYIYTMRTVVPQAITTWNIFKTAGLLETANLLNTLDGTNQSGLNLLRISRNLAVSIKEHLAITTEKPVWLAWSTEVFLAWEHYIKGRKGTEGRLHPIGLLVHGVPGTGKSHLVSQVLPGLVLARAGIIPHRKFGSQRTYNMPSDPEQNFFDGYYGQNVAYYDDLGAAKEGKDWLKIVHFVSTASAAVNMAELADKGTMFTSEFVFGTTNQTSFRTAETQLYCSEVLNRRFPFQFGLRINTAYRRDDGTLNYSKLQASLAAATDYAGEIRVYDAAFSFTPYSFLKGGDVSGPVSFGTIVDDIAYEYLRNAKLYTQSKENFAKHTPEPLAPLQDAKDASEQVKDSGYSPKDQALINAKVAIDGLMNALSEAQGETYHMASDGYQNVSGHDMDIQAVPRAKNILRWVKRTVPLEELETRIQTASEIYKYRAKYLTLETEWAKHPKLEETVTSLSHLKDSTPSHLIVGAESAFADGDDLGGVARIVVLLLRMAHYWHYEEGGVSPDWPLLGSFKRVLPPFAPHWDIQTMVRSHKEYPCLGIIGTIIPDDPPTDLAIRLAAVFGSTVRPVSFYDDKASDLGMAGVLLAAPAVFVGILVAVKAMQLVVGPLVRLFFPVEEQGYASESKRMPTRKLLKHEKQSGDSVKGLPSVVRNSLYILRSDRVVSGVLATDGRHFLCPRHVWRDLVSQELPIKLMWRTSDGEYVLRYDSFIPEATSIDLSYGGLAIDLVLVRVPNNIPHVRKIHNLFYTFAELEEKMRGKATQCQILREHLGRENLDVVISNEYSENNPCAERMFGWHFTSIRKTVKGDCGSPYVDRNNRPLAVHVAYDHLSSHVGAAPISQSALKEAVHFLSKTFGTAPTVQQEPPLTTVSEPQGFTGVEMECLGTIPGVAHHVPPDSAFIKSHIYDQELWTDPFVPSQKSNKGLYREMSKFDYLSEPTAPLDEETSYAVEYMADLFQADKSRCTATLTDDQVLNGDKTLRMAPLRSDTSAGFWGMGEPGKQATITKDYAPSGAAVLSYKPTTKDHPYYGVAFPAYLDKIEAECSTGDRATPSFWTTSMKDELLPAEKVARRGARLFEVPDLANTLLVKKYFGAFCSYYRSHPGISLSHLIGTDREEVWGKVRSHLTLPGWRLLAIDFSKYDGSVPPAAFGMFRQAVEAYYDDEGTEAAQVRASLLYDLQFSTHIGGRYIFSSTKGNKSGSFLTDVFNSVVNLWIWRVVFYRIYANEFNRSPTLAEFQRYIRFFVYGDDVVLAMDGNMVPHFDYDKIRVIIEDLGFFPTSADKQGEVAWCGIDDVTFLKSSFRTEGDVCMPALPKEIIHRELNYMRRGALDDINMRIQRIDQALQFAAWYGPDYFETISHQIREAVVNRDPLLLEFLEQRTYISVYKRVWAKQTALAYRSDLYFDATYTTICANSQALSLLNWSEDA